MGQISQSVTPLNSGMACQGRTLKLFVAILNLRRKCSVVNTGPQTSDEAVKACQGKAVELITNIYKLRYKLFL
jgi:hypothetical protein